jgi:hypothetical protein
VVDHCRVSHLHSRARRADHPAEYAHADRQAHLMDDATELPTAVHTYLATPKDQIGPLLEQLFTADAIVHDDGHTHIGLTAIRDWNNAVTSAFSYTRTVSEVEVRQSAAVTLVRLEGNFPGSPIDLHHHFSLHEGRICALTICT